MKKFTTLSLFIIFFFSTSIFAQDNFYRGKPVSGFADLHLHQMAEFAYGGGWLWGKHTGPASEAMNKCSGLNDHGFLVGEGFLGIHLFRRNGYPKYQGWPHWDSISHQQSHADALKKAHDDGLNVLIVSAVNFEPLAQIIPEKHRVKEWGYRDIPAIKRQINAAHKFAKEHDWYEIALSAMDARRIVHEGKLAVILAIETSDPFGDEDLMKQLDEYYKMGVRAIQPVHQLNNRFVGAAPHNFVFKIFQALRNLSPKKAEAKMLKTLAQLHGVSSPDKLPEEVKESAKRMMKCSIGFELDENGNNVMGLTAEGRTLIREMMKRKMLIDIAHMSRKGVLETYEMAKANKYYPLFISHAHIKEIMNPEKAKEEKSFPINFSHVIMRTGGIVGLRTGKDETRTYKYGSVKNNCHGSTASFAQMYEFSVNELKLAIGFASDLNGFITQIQPRFGKKHETCAGSSFKFESKHQQKLQGERLEKGIGTEFDTKGFAHIGLIGDIIKDLNKLKVNTEVLENSAERTIQMWERAYDENRTKVPYDVDLEKAKKAIEPYKSKKERKKEIKNS